MCCLPMVDSLWHETYNEDDHDLIHGGEDFDGDNNEDNAYCGCAENDVMTMMTMTMTTTIMLMTMMMINIL